MTAAAGFLGPLLARGVGLLLPLAVGAAGPPPAPAEDETGPPALRRLEFVARHMGTLFRIVLFAPDEESARTAATAAFARVGALDRLLSDYNPESELRRLEQQPAGTAVAVSAELFAVLERSQRLAAASGGAFDVTAGPIVRLWREVRRTGQPPTDRDRADALRRTGYTKLELNPVHRTVTLRAAGMQFDLGGIAKGYAADEALAVLARLGLPHAMVAAGGDLALGDAPPGTAGWKVELAPFGRSASDALTVVVANAGVSTSGDVEQFVEIAGTRYSHVVDPRTALGLTAPIAVTIIAPEATLADGLATACSVLAAGADEQLAACLDPAARAILHRRGPDGRVRRETIGAGPPGLRSIL